MTTPTSTGSRLRLGLAAVVLFAFGTLTPFYLMANTTAGTLLDARLYHRMLDDLGLARRLRAGLLRSVLTTLLTDRAGGEAPPSLRFVPPASWETMAQELIPEDWLAEQGHGLIEAFSAWLNGPALLPTAQVETGPLTERLRGPSGSLALVVLLEHTRACLPNEVVIAGDLPLGAYAVIMPCIPPNANLSVLGQASANYLADNMPPVINIPTAIVAGLLQPDSVERLDEFRYNVRWTRIALSLIGAFCLFLFMVFLLLTVRSGRDLLAMPITPLGLAGGGSLLLAAVLYASVTWITEPGLGRLDTVQWPGAETVVSEMLGYAGREVALRLAIWGGSLSALALAAWAAFKLSGPRKPRPEKNMVEPRDTLARRRFM